MKNLNKTKKMYVIGTVLIFIFSSFISSVGSLNINTIHSIENQLNFNKQVNNFEVPLADVWDVTLEFNEPGGSYDNAFFGEKTDASDGQDSYDVPKLPPSFPPYIRACFKTNFPDPYDELWNEYKHYPDTSKQWDLSVQWVPSDYVTPTTITISWNTSMVDESEYNVVKLCNSTGFQLKNMLTESSYSFTCPAVTPQIFYVKCQANNTAPNQPSNPSPSNGSKHVDVNTDLSWTCTDPDNDPLTYDIYFGTSSNPPLVQNNHSLNSYDPGTMNNNTIYYWKIIAWDNWGASNSSAIWHFSTNFAPNPPGSPSPTNSSTNVNINANLGWTCTDPDGDPLTYDVYFGTSSNPPLIQGNWPSNFYDLGTMSTGTLYYWRIVAKDDQGASTVGPLWHFTTNYAPNPPGSPNPTNGSTNVDINANLGWTCTDPDNDPITYDVYFGNISTPPLVSSGQTSTSYDPGTMNYETVYYWKIIAKDDQGATTSGPVWHFTTVDAPNNPPNAPSNPNPANGATNVEVYADLSWTCTDPDGDPLTYDVYFGTSSNPPLVSSNQTSTSYDPGTMSYLTTYYWKIVANDDQGASTSGPVWHFTTKANSPPNTPSSPNPANGATNVNVNADLSWTCTDPDGDTLTYDIYFGTNSNPPLVQNNQSLNSYDPGTMNINTTYYWKIVAWDSAGASTSGPIWDFTTAINSPPNTPSNPNPPNGAVDVNVNADLSWTCTDPDGDPITYDVYFGTNSNPPLVQNNQSLNSYDPGILNINTTYYWKIIAWDNFGNLVVGPIWNFTTGLETNQPPYAPSNPTPADDSTNLDVNTNLKWDGGDPDGDPVTYDVYFGKTYPLQKVASNYSDTLFDPGTMDFNTTYNWKIVAWDNHSASTSGPVWSFTTANKTNRPPLRPTIGGIIGIIVPNRPYVYNFSSNDPDLDDLYYYVDWGDGTYEDWSGPHPSGELVAIEHTWPPKTNLYQIKAKAKDAYGSESDWGSFFVFVLYPRNSGSSLFTRILLRLPIFQKIMIILPRINRLLQL